MRSRAASPLGGTLSGAFLNLFNPAYQQFQGATAGIRIEAALGCLLGAFYVHLKTRSLWRAVASFFAARPARTLSGVSGSR